MEAKMILLLEHEYGQQTIAIESYNKDAIYFIQLWRFDCTANNNNNYVFISKSSFKRYGINSNRIV